MLETPPSLCNLSLYHFLFLSPSSLSLPSPASSFFLPPFSLVCIFSRLFLLSPPLLSFAFPLPPNCLPLAPFLYQVSSIPTEVEIGVCKCSSCSILPSPSILPVISMFPIQEGGGREAGREESPIGVIFFSQGEERGERGGGQTGRKRGKTRKENFKKKKN